MMHTDTGMPAGPIEERMPVTPGMRALAWGLVSFFGFIVIFPSLVWPIGQLEQSLALLHIGTLALWSAIWTLGTGFWALIGARLVFGEWCRVRTTAWMVLLSGAFVSAAQIATLSEWTIARYGYNDPEFWGLTGGLFAAVAGVAVAGFGVVVAPKTAIWAPFVAVLGGVLLAAWIIVENVPGLADGLGSDSFQLAAVTFVSAAYVGVVSVISTARWMASGSPAQYP